MFCGEAELAPQRWHQGNRTYAAQWWRGGVCSSAYGGTYGFVLVVLCPSPVSSLRPVRFSSLALAAVSFRAVNAHRCVLDLLLV